MKLEDFNYHLPEELIAKYPCEKRDGCRLLVVNRENDTISHRIFSDVLDYLNPGDCLVLNDSKVLAARLFGYKKNTGGKVELLLIKHLGDKRWQSMVRPGKRIKVGDVIVINDKLGFEGTIVAPGPDGSTREIEFDYPIEAGESTLSKFYELLDKCGFMPLPPYINREATDADKDTYQTVYSRLEGSIASPTAGLHFTNELLERVKDKGVSLAFVTLHVGIGTFRPVQTENILEHHMHSESYFVSKKAADIINETKKNGGRVICVGTTSMRTIESAAVNKGDEFSIEECSGDTDIFIYPGYDFKLADGLITNFHLPKSTLLMLVSALYNREKMMEIYDEAVREGYRFFSYGDAMLII